VDLRDLREAVLVKTGVGDVTVAVAPALDLDLRAEGADVDVDLPVSTRSGGGGSGLVAGRLNDGGPLLRARTATGFLVASASSRG
jgi:hypothetical protein